MPFIVTVWANGFTNEAVKAKLELTALDALTANEADVASPVKLPLIETLYAPVVPPPAKEKSKSGGAATSNKPPAKLTQEQNDAAITKANEAIQKGADPAEVKARLRKAGVSFKE